MGFRQIYVLKDFSGRISLGFNFASRSGDNARK